MKTFEYRPWGRPDWLIKHSNVENWVVLACLSTELRSVESAAYLSQFAQHTVLVQIDDPLPHSREGDDNLRAENLIEFCSKTSVKHTVVRHDLKASIDAIEDIVNEILTKSANIILDITSFPKRWFFPLIRFLVSSRTALNVHVVYTKGNSHADILSENPEMLRVLPTFVSLEERNEHDYAFVGVGFQTHSMLMMFGDDKAKSLQMLFPFPPGPPATKRNWAFVQDVERIVLRDSNLTHDLDPIKYLQLEAIDVSQAFDILKLTTNSGDKTSIMAPYGPKTFSLAMCLFALAVEAAGKADIPVFYSQPQRYTSDYTDHASVIDGVMQNWSYAIKHDGKFLYELSDQV